MIWQFVTQAASTQGICMEMYNGEVVFQGIKAICFQSDVTQNSALQLLCIYSLERFEV